MYDEKHMIHLLSDDPEFRIKQQPKGEYEKLLCKDCEDIFQTKEDYTCKVLSGNMRLTRTPYPNGIHLQGLNYNLWKLFTHSILWRASVSKREFFTSIKLDRKIEEKLRKMLLVNNPGSPTDFACFTSISRNPELRALQTDIILAPEMLSDDAMKFCRFTMGGMYWFFLVQSVEKQAIFEIYAPKLDGSIFIPFTDKYSSKLTFEFLDGAAKAEITRKVKRDNKRV